MAKFAGFNTEQINTILAGAGRRGPPLAADEAQNLLNADKRYNAFYNRQVEKAMALVEGRQMATGGYVFPGRDARGRLNKLDPKNNPEYAENIDQQMAAVNRLQNSFPTPLEEMSPRRFQTGGTTTDPAKAYLDTAQQNYSDALKRQQEARDALAADASNESLKTALEAADSETARLQEARNQATFQFKETASDTPAELIQKTTVD